MNYTLAIDTATSVCSAALFADDAVLGERSAITNQRHNETLPSMVGELLAMADIMPAQIDLICVSIGPGSFSGLRVGLSYAKGFAEGAGAKIITVCTLKALSLRLAKAAEKSGLDLSRNIVPIVIARKEEVFGEMFFVIDGVAISASKTFIANASSIGELLGEGAIIGGPGLNTLAFEDHFLSEHNLTLLADVVPSAEEVGIIGRRQWLNSPDSFEDFASLEPRYIQEFTVRVGKGF